MGAAVWRRSMTAVARTRVESGMDGGIEALAAVEGVTAGETGGNLAGGGPERKTWKKCPAWVVRTTFFAPALTPPPWVVRTTFPPLARCQHPP